MDRVGLFKEMGYVTINDKYKERGGKQIVYHWDAHLHLKCSHTYIHHTCLVQGNYSFCGLELFCIPTHSNWSYLIEYHTELVSLYYLYTQYFFLLLSLYKESSIFELIACL